jgi:hypothetical protein
MQLTLHHFKHKILIIMKRLQFTDPLLAIGLIFLVSCGNKGSSNSSAKDSTKSSKSSDPTEAQDLGSSTYNPNPNPGDTVKTKQDSTRRQQQK